MSKKILVEIDESAVAATYLNLGASYIFQYDGSQSPNKPRVYHTVKVYPHAAS